MHTSSYKDNILLFTCYFFQFSVWVCHLGYLSWLFVRLSLAVFCKYAKYIIVDSMQCKIVHGNTYVIMLFTVKGYF